jgi:DNA repair protein RadC
MKSGKEGHRKRLRDRFLQNGLGGFLDYEIIEMLLTLGTPRKDCKQIAKEVLKKSGSLDAVFDASLEDLKKIKGVGPSNAFGLKLFQAVSERLAKEKILGKIILDSPIAVVNYLQKSIGREKREHFVILSLDTHSHLIKVSNISIGTLDASLVHPREVFNEAIRVSADRIILAHNHPSGSIEPSKEDVAITKQLKCAGKILGIDILDHIIISKDGYKSLREADLM